MMYVFAFGIPSTLVSAFITLSDAVFYPWYEIAPRVTSLSPLDDQRLGGLIMWIPGMLIFWVGISAVFFRWTKEEYSSWGGKAGTKASMVALIALGALVPGNLMAQNASSDNPPEGDPVSWAVETEVGASVFFGAKDQTTVATELGIVRDSRLLEVETEYSFLYGEATDDEGENFVNKRSWEIAANLDYRGFSWLNPYVFGATLSSLEKKIRRRHRAGGGAKLTVVDSETSRLDFAAALSVEQTLGTSDSGAKAEWVGRWTGQARFRRSFSEDRAVFQASLDYDPQFQKIENYTLTAESSLALRISEIVSLKLSVRDNFDSRAKARGAISNNDGRFLVGVLAAF
jgi:hypothetical protein